MSQASSDSNVNGPAGPPGLISTNPYDSASANAVNNRTQQVQREIVANSFTFDVSPKSPLLPPTNLVRKQPNNPEGIKKILTPQLQANNRFAGGRYGNKPEYGRNNKTAENTVFHQSIIDNEKLKRMDDFDREFNEDDDWARSDETFDYNKKLARYSILISYPSLNRPYT